MASTVRTRRTIDNAGADAVIAAAERHANEHGYRVVIAVVDHTGELIAMRRTEGAQVASSRVAVDKARTAAIFVRPSREMEEQVTGGRLGALALHGASCLTGGIPLEVDGETVNITAVSMGNPHVVIFVDDVETAPVTTLGPKIENHPSFPERTNVHFVQVDSATEAIQRTWERGSGETLACGTGASATVVAGCLNEKLRAEAVIRVRGGVLEVAWSDDDNVYLTGPAAAVFEGEWLEVSD